jgi:hypothetical protein
LHKYFPDFEINGKLCEVKGDHLLKDNKLYFPYRTGLSETELSVIDDVYAAKDACMKENNVIVIRSSELSNLNNIIKL